MTTTDNLIGQRVVALPDTWFAGSHGIIVDTAPGAVHLGEVIVQWDSDSSRTIYPLTALCRELP